MGGRSSPRCVDLSCLVTSLCGGGTRLQARETKADKLRPVLSCFSRRLLTTQSGSRSAQFEHQILITPDGASVLTR